MLEEGKHCSIDVIFILNERYGKDIKFIIYQTEKCSRIYAMRVTRKSFKTKMPLKEEWQGKSGAELQEISGVNDATFVHASGFTGGALSLEGAMQMCKLSLLK